MPGKLPALQPSISEVHPPIPVASPAPLLGHHPPIHLGPLAENAPGDTVTTPTASMLAATSSCTLFDDVFAEDPTTNDLEAFIAELTGKEAALFVTSGTMGNQLSIRTALGGPPHSVLADSRSHVIGWYPTPLPLPLPHLQQSDIR